MPCRSFEHHLSELRELHFLEEDFRFTSVGFLRSVGELAFADNPALAPDLQTLTFRYAPARTLRLSLALWKHVLQRAVA